VGAQLEARRSMLHGFLHLYVVFNARFALMVSVGERRHDSTEVLIVNFNFICNELVFP
jgi:hypothetical protein